MSAFIIGILISCIVFCCRRKFKLRKPQPKRESTKCEVEESYQELDLTKMNPEENYQTLTVGAGTAENDSTYTELNKTREMENNYQSLS